MTHPRLSAVPAALLLLFLTAPLAAEQMIPCKPMDWPHWRGPEMNGISREKNIPVEWSEKGENLLWSNDSLGTRSTPIVMDGRLYTIVRDQPATEFEGEKVVCLDAATGELLWENRFNVFLSDVPDTRVGWSSVAGDPATGKIFVLGVCDYFACIDGETGETEWSHALSEEYGMLNTYGGRTNFPLVHENRVIISGIVIGWGEMAKPAHRFIAFDIRNGQPVWYETTRLLPEDTTYSAPVLGVVDGQLQMAFGAGDGSFYGYQPRSGKKIWSYDVSMRGINTTPTLHGSVLIGGHSEENVDGNVMGALFAIDVTKQGDITKTGELWRNTEQFVGKAAPLVVDDRIYAVEDNGTFLVIDLKTGERIAKQKIGTQGRSSPLYVDGKIYVAEANGRWYVFEPTEDGVKTLVRRRLSAGVNASPIVSHGRLYVTTDEALYCIGFKDQEPETEELPQPEAETPVEQDQTPATVQVVPVESLLYPGQGQPLQVLLYNSNGQFLSVADAADVQFSVEGVGAVDANGRYATDAKSPGGAATITAKVGDITGTARSRVIPDLPLAFDFSRGVVPVQWVGMRYRHVTIDFDYFSELRKQNPVAAKMYVYLNASFVNSGAPQLKFDDSTPRQTWSDIRRYLGMTETATDLASSQAAMNAGLSKLKDDGVLSDFSWSEVPSGPQLTVARGPREISDGGTMVKITTIPKGTRSQGWIGHPTWHDYTTQADVLGAAEELSGTDRAKMPDIGLITQRYRMEMMGAAQQLKLFSWVSHEIKYKEVPFEWQPNVWYTMKLRVENAEIDGVPTAVVKGKVWERGTEEPEAWSIEWTDTPPNTQGSPGFVGNAKDAEIFFDNVRVYSNDSK